MALFQPRGPVYLRELDANLNPGVAFQICPDTISFNPKVDDWTHTNKCGVTDVEDARGINALSAEISMSFPTRTDKDRALALLGTKNAADVAPGTVTDEVLPDVAVNDVVFLGGKTRHRTITALTIHGDGSPTGPLLTLDTDYTLDAVTGRVTFLTGQTAPRASYTYQDPESVAMLTAATKEYALDMEFYNRQNGNQKGSLELFRVRFDPADGIDMMPDKQQNLNLKGSCLADTTREADDTEFGQFGRLVNIE